MTAHYLSEEELAGLDGYISKIEKDTSRLSLKYKWELWSLRHLPAAVCELAGKMSIWREEYKQKKLKKG